MLNLVMAKQRFGLERNTMLLLLGQAISRGGDQLSNVAFLWLVITLTGSAAALGLVMTALIVPNIAVRLIGGVFIDRLSKKVVLVLADVMRGTLMVALAALTLAGRVNLWCFLGIAVGLGTGQALFEPAFSATIPLIVAKDRLLRFNSMLQAVNRGVGIVVPAGAGMVVATIGTPAALALDGLSFVLSAISILLLVMPETSQRAAQMVRPVWAELREGLQVALANRFVRMLFIAVGLIDFADALVVIYPVHIAHALGGGVAWYGFLNAAVMAGLFTTNLLFIWLGRRSKAGGVFFASVLVEGIGVLAFGLSRSLFFDLFAFFLFGAGMAGFGTAAATLIQRRIDKALLGRVFNLYGIFGLALMPVGYAVAGALTKLVSTGVVLSLAGVLIMVTAVGLLGQRAGFDDLAAAQS
jgi:DHA3 family macrolide efflux protein-like MFS transporter